ncbi:hypothetical protein TFLX_03706 [Thermoflexales bacterium]|nr:hypothetical protein TFLX_03706 [Thermoflexales bacterium]
MRRCFAVLLVIFFVSVSLISLVTVVQGQTPTGLAGDEFTKPLIKGTGEEWPTFVGVGHSLRYPPAWQAQSYQAQGGLRNGALFQFSWTDVQGLAAQIEALEIVNASDGVAALDTELAYWQQTTQHAYAVEAVTVQGHPGWWIHAAQPLDPLGLTGTLWTDWGERIYRFRLICRPAACVESEQQLRQMLSTLQIATVDWQRAPAPPHSPDRQAMPAEETLVPNSPSIVTYNRSAAYAYANSWWNQQNNSDGCYLWYSSVLGCVKDPGDYGVDGAHFVNRAVYAGGRPIPALWDAAAVNAVGLRNWLQGDGWTTTPAAQAAIGDVAIMGPFSNPCWTGLVVVTGTNPTLATHSAELWASTSSMYCYDNGNPNLRQDLPAREHRSRYVASVSAFDHEANSAARHENQERNAYGQPQCGLARLLIQLPGWDTAHWRFPSRGGREERSTV